MEHYPKRETLRRWLLAGSCFAVLLFFFSPVWSSFLAWSRIPEMGGLIEVRRGVSVLTQVESPGIAIQDRLHEAIQWRLLFPVLGNVFNLSTPLLFSLAHAGSLLSLAYLIGQLRERGLNFPNAGLATIIMGSSSWFFTSTGWLGYFDSWFALGLLVLCFSRKPWLLWLACLLAPWVDERFVLAAPLALFCRYLIEDQTRKAETKPVRWAQEYIIPASLVAVFAIVRLLILPGFSASGATVGGYLATQHNFQAPLGRILLGIWDGLRVGWCFVGVLFWLSWKRRSLLLGAGAALVVLLLVGLGTAQDFSRSMTMLIPLAGAGLVLAVAAAPAWLSTALRIGALAALLLPAHHVMNDRVQPIFYLYHELAALETPPPMLNAQLYELDGIKAMEEGDRQRAESRLAMAIKLAENPSSACKHRGLLRAGAGEWKEALEDFSTMVTLEPQNPDAWFMRSQARLAMGDRQQAWTDLQQALKIAPSEWARRPDVTRFITKLQR